MQLGNKARLITYVQIKKCENDIYTTINLPLFQVKLEPKRNNIEALEITHMLDTKIKTKLLKTRNSKPQCKQIGHSKNYCNKMPKCVKCGENHLSNECTKSKSTKSECANCELK